MDDGPIRDSNQSPDFVLNLNRNHFVKFGNRSVVSNNQNKLFPTRLQRKVERINGFLCCSLIKDAEKYSSL